MKNQGTIRELLAEFIGSMFLLTVVNGVAIMFSSHLDGDSMNVILTSAIAVPAILFVIIELFGPISGAHFNPVVTMVMFFEKQITAIKSIQYILAQLLGGIVGIMVSHLMFYHESDGLLFISEVARPDFNYFSEGIGTFMLVFAVLALTKTKSDKATFVIPLLVGGNILATSSTMFANPQVTLARMFTNSVAGVRPVDGLAFIAMQVIGAILAYIVYKLLFKRRTEDIQGTSLDGSVKKIIH